MYRLRITDQAEEDIRQNLYWWGENRSHEQAERWYDGVYAKIHTLVSTAGRYTPATEPSLRALGLKQASFGIGRRPTHRILYSIEGDEVVIYRVRAFKQDAIGPGDLRGD